jgi:K+-transporting ATPase ATPase C chain
MSEEQVRELVRQNTDDRDFGIWGQPRVNMMTLNFALDRLAQK